MTVIGTYWAIRQKGTMKFLPENYGAGYTHTEPVAGPQPRLLGSHKAAHLALTAWCKGVAMVSHSRSYSWDGGINDDVGGIEYEPVAGRSKEAMEIIELVLVLK